MSDKWYVLSENAQYEIIMFFIKLAFFIMIVAGFCMHWTGDENLSGWGIAFIVNGFIFLMGFVSAEESEQNNKSKR